MSVALSLRGVSRAYDLHGRRVEALRDVTLEVPAGAFVAIVGRSGCGKTTLLRLVAGLEVPDSGVIAFGGPGGTPAAAPRLGMAFQEPRLLPWMTVRDNVALALRHAPAGPDAADRAATALRAMGLSGFEAAMPGQLSGGMAQRAALARALVRDPEFLLMDEPFGALDALTRLQLQRELAAVWAERRMSVLFVTHDVTEAVWLADLVLVMDRGRIAARLPVPLPHPRDVAATAFHRLRERVLEAVLGTPATTTSATPNRENADVLRSAS